MTSHVYDGTAEVGNDVTEVVKLKAKELFAVCDKDDKGFINKVDMQGLHGEVPLSDEQLNEVFDNLDEDGNGFLTFDEFFQGFGGFLGLNSSYNEASEHSYDEVSGHVECVHEYDDSNNARDLSEIIARIASETSFNRENEPAVLDLWNKMQENNKSISVEDFVEIVIRELDEVTHEKNAMEKTLKERSLSHESEVRQLYEEMEHQIKEERHKIITEEVQRERSASQILQNELKQKEEHLSHVIERQENLEKQVANLNSGKTEAKSENAQLVQLNESLVEELQNTRSDLEETRLRLEMIKQQKEEEEEKNDAEKEARKLDLEKKSLILQLEMLRDVNRKLRDDRDEIIERSKQSIGDQQTSTPKQKAPLFTQGSNVGKYFPKDALRCEVLADIPTLTEIEEIEVEHEHSGLNGRNNTDTLSSIESDSSIYRDDGAKTTSNLNNNNHVDVDGVKFTSLREGRRGSVTSQSSHHKHDKDVSRARFYRKLSRDPHQSDGSDHGDMNLHDNYYQANNSATNHRVDSIDGYFDHSMVAKPTPDRVYKVVFVGNSGVGKTSFIQQFVSKIFRSSISATIGVDYQMKTVAVDGQSIALQLWDTAGQERYRSITRQYFRKADGVIVIYDVTNEKSFLAVRNWMQSVQEGADPNAVILLIGNKDDVTSMRQVTPKEGAKLAEEYGAMFSETSAKSGKNVPDSMLSFAAHLTRLEDEQRESVLSLAASDEEAKKMSGCCGGRKTTKYKY